jgi:hypothetical protein
MTVKKTSGGYGSYYNPTKVNRRSKVVMMAEAAGGYG